MKETYLLISDVAKLLNVESHVLRYWEEELELNITRNEFGHRYYGKKDIQLLTQVKELKEQGLQLKAIKNLLPKISSGNNTNLILMPTAQTTSATSLRPLGHPKMPPADHIPQPAGPVDKMAEFRAILGGIVTKAIKENNAVLGKEVSAQVSQRVLKEMDYLMRTHEDSLEEHFQNLDQAIRNQQRINHEKDKPRLFGRKNKFKEVAMTKE